MSLARVTCTLVVLASASLPTKVCSACPVLLLRSLIYLCSLSTFADTPLSPKCLRVHPGAEQDQPEVGLPACPDCRRHSVCLGRDFLSTTRSIGYLRTSSNSLARFKHHLFKRFKPRRTSLVWASNSNYSTSSSEKFFAAVKDCCFCAWLGLATQDARLVLQSMRPCSGAPSASLSRALRELPRALAL